MSYGTRRANLQDIASLLNHSVTMDLSTPAQHFENFCKNYGFVHTTSSPQYPQSNGEVERAVQTIESLLKKAQDPYKALLNYRNTPLEGIGLSPVQLLMGRRLKTCLPTNADLLKTHGAQEIKEQFQKRKEKEKV